MLMGAKAIANKEGLLQVNGHKLRLWLVFDKAHATPKLWSYLG